MPHRCDIIDVEEALTKTGPELFKELLRLYPVAEPDDYFKQGQWKNEMMKNDIVLLESHRREAGAPDPPDLEDLKVPKLPDEGAAKTALASALGLKLQGTPTATGLASAATAGASATATPVVEIRLIALFVAKWKLDPVTAKTALAKLESTHRRYIIQTFKPATTGPEATKELETFIAACEADGSWDKPAGESKPAGENGTASNGAGGATATATPAATPATVTPKAGGVTAASPRPPITNQAFLAGALNTGVKRPIGSLATNPALANKLPKATPATGIRPPGGMLRPAVRPAGS